MNRLIEQLQKHKDNRGMMANFRCALVPSKKHRAWPALNRLGISIDDKEYAHIATHIAGFFATNSEVANTGNLGTTCKTIQSLRGEKLGEDGKLTQTERRFQHLLTAEKAEIFSRVLRIVLMAKAHGVPINYQQLATDLKFWPSERTKTEWAAAFWTRGEKTDAEEGA